MQVDHVATSAPPHHISAHVGSTCQCGHELIKFLLYSELAQVLWSASRHPKM